MCIVILVYRLIEAEVSNVVKMFVVLAAAICYVLTHTYINIPHEILWLMCGLLKKYRIILNSFIEKLLISLK